MLVIVGVEPSYLSLRGNTGACHGSSDDTDSGHSCNRLRQAIPRWTATRPARCSSLRLVRRSSPPRTVHPPWKRFVPPPRRFVAIRWREARRVPKVLSMNCTCNGRTTMNAKHLIVTLSLMRAAGATLAALKRGNVEAPKSMPAAECVEVTEAAIPRVVVTARRDQVQGAETPVARVVVTARRVAAGQVVAARN